MAILHRPGVESGVPGGRAATVPAGDFDDGAEAVGEGDSLVGVGVLLDGATGEGVTAGGTSSRTD
ncbi:hypothetical protein [Micromonospora orduensis]|uniref:hypothetical protein n=1 Tax=Micromonospora orduensis TaxID=1420891 RepID=UPI003401F004